MILMRAQRSSNAMFRSIASSILCSPLLLMGGEAVAVGHEMTYTPVTPCRLADTRSAGGALGANNARDFKVWVPSGGFAVQGGDAGNCNVPANPSAVALNIAAVSPRGAGNLVVYPAGSALPNTSALNYHRGPALFGQGCARQLHRAGDAQGFYRRRGLGIERDRGRIRS